jgi:hypothetical protein
VVSGKWKIAMRPKIQSYEDLEVWQLAMTLDEQCYQLTATFPREETYGLSAQIRRAAVSIQHCGGVRTEPNGQLLEFSQNRARFG